MVLSVHNGVFIYCPKVLALRYLLAGSKLAVFLFINKYNFLLFDKI
jgi:hypothetical protein